ncbi:fimbria/pilus periplasmic chaperone [uncultured Erythrobacter sp.]|nr:fimbria/pilus periplasmic chaperone [uncultured Erythrobacter sp.]
MAVDLDTFGRGSVARIQFTNTADREFPVEVRVYLGEISEDGELELTPAEDDFLIFPPQTVIDPLGEQVIRVQYVGEPALEQAKVYYVSLSELPVPLEAGGGPKVQVTVRFNVFVNVQPEGAEALPRVDTIESAEVEEEKGIRVRLANDGNGMLLAGQRAWRITGNTTSGEAFEREFTTAQMGVIVGAGVVAPSKARNFFIPLSIDVDAASVAVDIE